jgi:hypothetical protein
MRIFFAGASEVIGRHLLPLLIDAGHTVGAVTRSPSKAGLLASAGAQAIVCDVFDRQQRARAVRTFAHDLVSHELTDLPDNLSDLPGDSLLNARVRVEGTRNLLDAMAGLAQVRIVAQSVAWTMHPGREADPVSSLDQEVLTADGAALRYGCLYGPGTYFESELPPRPRVRIDEAATRSLPALVAPMACCPSSTEANQQCARYSSSVARRHLHDASARKQAHHGYSNF